MWKYLIFILPYLYLSQWNVWSNMIKGFIVPKAITKSTDKNLTDFIYKKTGIKLVSFNFQKSNKYFAYCGWLWGKPLFVISTAAYEKFKGDAMDWLILHEIGHYALFHTFWFIVVESFYTLLGITLLSFIHSFPLFLIFAVVLVFVLASISIQTNKLFDLWANQYAVRRMDNPKGMAVGMRMFIAQAKERKIYKDSFLMKLFYPWNFGMYYRGIADSEREIRKRNNEKNDR